MIAAVREQWSYRYLIWNLAQRDLRSRYKKSILGWLWSLLNPASNLIIYTIVFGMLLGAKITPAANGDESFGLFLFSGLVVWNFFNLVVNGSIGALATSGQLLKKVYFPATAPAVANLLVALTQVGIETAILAAIMLWWNPGPYMLLVPFVVIFTGLFALGLGLWASILNLFYRDIGYLVAIALNVWFYATPIVYPPSTTEGRYVFGVELARIMKLNPITDLVAINRDLFYYNKFPNFGEVAYVVVATIVSLAVGLYMFNRKAQYVSEEV